MNWIVITIGTALVLALLTATVGPFFVDWTAYRGAIEAEASRILGTDVIIDGEADVRILPSPRIRLTEVRLGGTGERALFSADTVKLDVGLAPLFSGRFEVRELTLEAPAAEIVVERDGTVSAPAGAGDAALASWFAAADISVGRIALRNGRIAIADRRTGGRYDIDGIDLDGSARSLRGPFTAAGRAGIGGRTMDVRLAGGALESGTMPLSARFSDDTLQATFEGAIVPRADSPSMRGEIAVTGTGATPFGLTGALQAGSDAATLTRGTLRYGTAEAALELSAAATYAFAEPDPVLLALEARQIDLDRLTRALAPAREDDPVAHPPAETAALLARHLAPVLALAGGQGDGAPAITAALDIGTIVFGGSLIHDVTAAVETGPEGLRVERAEALLPGDTSAEFSGRLAAAVRGNLRVSAPQPALFARWWTGEAVGTTMLDPVLFEADIDTALGGFDATRLSLRIGQSNATGRVRYQPRNGAAPLLDVALTVPRLAAADAANLATMLQTAGVGGETLPNIDIDLAVERMLIGGIEGSALNIDASYRDNILTVDALAAEDFAGAQVFASGSIGNLVGEPVGVIEGTIVLNDGARMASALGPFLTEEPMLGALAARLTDFAPADLRFSLSGGSGPEGDDLALRVDGALGGTDLSLRTTSAPPGSGWFDAPAALIVDAENEDAGRLFTQLGLPVTPGAGPGSLSISLQGTPSVGMSGSSRLTGLGLAGDFTGRVSFDGSVAPAGRLSLDAETLAPFAAAFGHSLPETGPLSLSATLAPAADGALRLERLAGEFGGVAVSGDMTVSAGTLTGSLDLTEADLEALTGLVLGENAWQAPQEGYWPAAAFGNPLLPDLAVDLTVSADRLGIGSLVAQDATFDLALDPARFALTGGRASAAGGTLEGELTLTRTGTQSDLAASLRLEGADLGSLVWRDGGAPVATGRLTLDAAVASSGYTVSGLVARLTGTGALSISDGSIRNLNPAPFDLDAATDASPRAAGNEQNDPATNGSEPDDTEVGDAQVSDAFTAHLAAGNLDFSRLDARLAITAGTAHLEDVALDVASAATLSAAVADLTAWRLTSDFTIALDTESTEDVAVGLRFDGPLDAPTRQLNTAALTSWLNLRRLERQVQAVEEQNQALEAEANALTPPPLPGTPPEDTAPVEASPADAPPPAPAGTSAPAAPGGADRDTSEPDTADPAAGPGAAEDDDLAGEATTPSNETPIPVPAPPPPTANETPPAEEAGPPRADGIRFLAPVTRERAPIDA